MLKAGVAIPRAPAPAAPSMPEFIESLLGEARLEVIGVDSIKININTH